MPAGLLDRLQRISVFANKVAHEIVYKETEILEKTIPRMFDVVQMVAEFSCNYVRRRRFGKQSPSLDRAVADDRRENAGWAALPGGD